MKNRERDPLNPNWLPFPGINWQVDQVHSHVSLHTDNEITFSCPHAILQPRSRFHRCSNGWMRGAVQRGDSEHSRSRITEKLMTTDVFSYNFNGT